MKLLRLYLEDGSTPPLDLIHLRISPWYQFRYPGVLAVRRNRRVSRDNARRRPAGGQPVRAHPNRDGRNEEGVLQGYSTTLNLFIRWEQGELRWHDPETGQHIIRYEDLNNRAQSEREAREAAENRADTAEARVRELEEELRRRQQP